MMRRIGFAVVFVVAASFISGCGYIDERDVRPGVVLVARKEALGMWDPWTDGRQYPPEDSITISSGSLITVQPNESNFYKFGGWVRAVFVDPDTEESILRWFRWREFVLFTEEGG